MEKGGKFSYAVIEFVLNEVVYVSAAPMKWMDNNSCLWPPKKGKERKEIINNGEPGADWIQLQDIKILGKYATYKEALYHEKKKINSDSESAQEGPDGKQKRKIIKNFKYRDNSLSPPPRIDEDDESAYASSSSSEEDSEIRHTAKSTCRKQQKEKIVKNTSNTSKDRKTNKEDEQKQSVVSSNDDLVIHAISNLSTFNNTATLVNNDMANLINNAEIVLEDSGINQYQTAVPEPDSTDTKINKIINLLMEIKVQQDLFAERLDHIENMLQSNRNIVASVDMENIQLNLPFMDVAAIQEYDEQLRVNEEMQKYLFNFLQYIGGTTNKTCISRCLEKVFSNYVGQFCCWTGKRGNFKVSSLKIIDIIKRAVRISYPSMADDFFERNVMMWFHHSKTRYQRQEKS